MPPVNNLAPTPAPKPSGLQAFLNYAGQALGIAENSGLINPTVRNAQAEAARLELENRRRVNIMLAITAGLLIVLIAYYLVIRRK